MEISYCNVIVLSLTMKVVTVNWYFFVSNKLNFKLKIAKDTFSQIFMYTSEIIYVSIIILNSIQSFFSFLISIYETYSDSSVSKKNAWRSFCFQADARFFFECFVDIHITNIYRLIPKRDIVVYLKYYVKFIYE